MELRCHNEPLVPRLDGLFLVPDRFQNLFYGGDVTQQC